VNTIEQSSSGIPALDERLGGLQAGRYYLLTGSPGAGKSSACLHFLAEGLRLGQRCAIVTQENASDMFAQARFIGHDFTAAAADDRLVVLQYLLDFSSNYSRVGDPRAVSDELLRACGSEPPDRLVVDSILPFVQAGGTSNGAVLALVSLMENATTTAFFTVPGDLGDSFYARLYDPLGTGTAGILHFEPDGDDVRKISIRKIRQTPLSTEPIRFMIKAGVGIVELEDGDDEHPAPAEPGRRIAVVNSGGHLGGDFYSSLEQEYEIEGHASPAELDVAAIGSLSVIVVVVDAMTADEVLAFVRAIRRKSGTPIVLIAEGEGLRASTRTRALRSGVDDFLTLDASPQEVVARVEAARIRGPRPMSDRFRRDRLIVQPRDDQGSILALPESEIIRAARHHLANTDHPVFALVRLRLGDDALPIAWQALGKALRLRDGDLMARGANSDELVLYLNDISRRHARDLIERVMSGDPRLENAGVEMEHYPVDAERIESWLRDETAPGELLAAG
jgi:KaiC/GvpD/RAD55 family RecA-like ATPase/DNA-binding NarL/FixJ family response regulator